MVIDTNNINSGSTSSSSRSRNAAPVAPAAPKTQAASTDAVVSNSKDNVVLSAEAQNLTRLQTKISSLPDVNMDRVAAIRLAIAEGRFEINAERIAENMLKQDELLS